MARKTNMQRIEAVAAELPEAERVALESLAKGILPPESGE